MTCTGTQSTHIVLLDNLDETGKVELGKETEVVHVGHEVGNFLLELSEPPIKAALTVPPVRRPSIIIITSAIVIPPVPHVPLHVSRGGRMMIALFIFRIRRFNEMHHLSFERVNPGNDLFRLSTLEAFTFGQLVFERLDEFGFGSVGPRGGGLDLLLESTVCDVLVGPFRVARVLICQSDPCTYRPGR
jgi:hypothetical protein